MVGKMEPGTWLVNYVRVRFLDTSGRHFCKEFRNVVCREGNMLRTCWQVGGAVQIKE